MNNPEDNMTHSRFADVETNNNSKLSPIYGYWSEPLVSLDEATHRVSHLIPDLTRYAKEAKKRCHYPNEHGLSKDEAASIFLYSMEWGSKSFYRVLNKVLRVEDQQALKPFFPFLKLFDTAYSKLPLYKGNIWRGVNLDASQNFKKGDQITWWNVSSCSRDVNVIKQFLQSNGTLFLIEASNGRDLGGYTNFPQETEVILTPGTKLDVIANSLNCNDILHVVHLRELFDDEAPSAVTSLNIVTATPSALSIVNLNVGGERHVCARETLTFLGGTLLSDLFSGKKDHKLIKDKDGYIFLDYDPKLFSHLLNQLRSWSANPTKERIFEPPPTGKRKFVDFVRQLKFPEHFISGGSISLKEKFKNWFNGFFNLFKRAPKSVMEPSITAEPIVKPSITSGEKFEEAHGDARLNDDGSLCVCESDYIPSWGCVLGTRVYSRGVHYIRMKVEGYEAVLGILSKNIEPKCCPSFNNTPGTYGWFTNGHDVVINGTTRKKKNQWTVASKTNDIYKFTLDCDGHRLRIENERSKEHDEMRVNLDQTPFPWRLFITIGSFDAVGLL